MNPCPQGAAGICPTRRKRERSRLHPSLGMQSPSCSQLPGRSNMSIRHALTHACDPSLGMAPGGSSQGFQAALAVAQGVVCSLRGARWQRCQLRQDIYLVTHTTARRAPGSALPPAEKSNHSLPKSLSRRISRLLTGFQRGCSSRVVADVPPGLSLEQSFSYCCLAPPQLQLLSLLWASRAPNSNTSVKGN